MDSMIDLAMFEDMFCDNFFTLTFGSLKLHFFETCAHGMVTSVTEMFW